MREIKVTKVDENLTIVEGELCKDSIREILGWSKNPDFRFLPESEDIFEKDFFSL